MLIEVVKSEIHLKDASGDVFQKVQIPFGIDARDALNEVVRAINISRIESGYDSVLLPHPERLFNNPWYREDIPYDRTKK
jgi:hypothetical protein